MATQRVKNISYLARVELNLSEAEVSGDIFIIPSGAEILALNVEVVEAGDAGLKIDLGLNDSAEFFANDLTIDILGNHASSVVTTSTKESLINYTLSTNATQGKLIFRLYYFLPSEILAEY
ncbi:hypothetical protein FMM55_00685 [Campylobacter sp. LR196d]|uniref:hypothetical protein n=1 Tax=Campylobacter sp. LR196d TaxID=2593543 RepID=UPI00123A9BC1|nr:hypothetical protein [Campylobacter sp. LR196d]KAA6228837.1 hypothetical protein FMM55_00685 [Campylobacter sp. LR196d]